MIDDMAVLYKSLGGSQADALGTASDQNVETLALLDLVQAHCGSELWDWLFCRILFQLHRSFSMHLLSNKSYWYAQAEACCFLRPGLRVPCVFNP